MLRSTITATTFAMAGLLALSSVASAQIRQQQGQSRSLCMNGAVMTGTSFGRVPMERVNGFDVTPELVQGAALHAAVAADSQPAVERALIERMSSQGKWGRVEERIWPQVRDGLMSARPQADAVAQQKREIAGRVIAGTFAGIGSMAMNGSIDSGINAAQNYGPRGAELAQSNQLRMPTGGAQIITGRALDGAVDQMVASPCEISAGQVLQQLRTR